MVKNSGFTEILLYKSSTGDVKVEVFLQDETIWLNQKKISDLFNVDRSVITKHLKNIFESEELEEKSNVQKMHISNSDKPVKYYNLDVIIAVGYRVNSKRATQFRIWASKILKEYIIKGFAMDDNRLKNPNNIFGKDYFDEQLERIKDIRSSERRFYQKITDIYSECSIDYDSSSDITKDFFQKVQNKLHYAIHKNTASELIYKRANSKEDNMGLTTWRNAPKGKIRKHDVLVAKNYLKKDELDKLNKIVSMYLDYAEMQARNRKIMYMKDWIEKLNKFLEFNEKGILEDAGKITHELAKEFAENEFEKYRKKTDRKIESDFDRLVKINND